MMESRLVKSYLLIPAISVFLLGISQGQAGSLLTNEEAQQGWIKDSPGTLRWIDSHKLSEIKSEISSRQAEIVQPPLTARPVLPPGFRAEKIIQNLANPRTIKIAPNGDIFIAESGGGRIKVYKWGEDKKTQYVGTFADDLQRPFGIAFFPTDHPRYVYIAEEHQIVRYPYDGTARPSGPKEIIISDLPEGGHWTRDLAVSNDNKRLFYSIGSRGNIAEGNTELAPQNGWGALAGSELGRAMVFSFDAEGKEIHPYATGLRNCNGLTIQPKTRKLWCVVNERDGLGDRLPPDYATHIEEGAFYGWPFFYIGQNPDPRHARIPEDLETKVKVPDVLLEAHSAPLGMVFYEGSQFPSEYRGSAFVALHGSWNRATLSGYKIIRLLFEDGKPTGQYEDFATGFVLNQNQVWARPVGLAIMPDGSLLMSEDGNDTIWRITYRQ